MTTIDERNVQAVAQSAIHTALAERRIRQQLARGDHFADVERYIEELALDQDLKSALWMIAWAELPLPERRDMILQAAVDRREESRAVGAQSEQARNQSAMLIGQAKSAQARRIAARIARTLLP